MAQSNWAVMDGSIDKGTGDGWFGTTIRRLITSGVSRPTLNADNGDNGFVFGFNSLSTTEGAVALSCASNLFAPIATPDSQGGGSIRGAVKRGVGGGRTGFSPFLFIGAQSNSVDASAYVLGLENANPSRIVLYKGPVSNGAPAVTGSGSRVLRHSKAGYQWDVWHHLRLDMIVNVNGENSDVILRAYRSSVGEIDPVTKVLVGCENPQWEPIEFDDSLNSLMGAGAFIDDALAVNSGSIPFAFGYLGFGFQSSDVNRNAYFDCIEVFRQNPIAS